MTVWLLYMFFFMCLPREKYKAADKRRRGKEDGRKRRAACFGSVAAVARCDHMLLQVDSVSRQL